MQTRTVKLMVTREEVWFPEFDVPAHMTDDEALEYIYAEAPDEVFDEYLNKYTYDQKLMVTRNGTHVSVVEKGPEA